MNSKIPEKPNNRIKIKTSVCLGSLLLTSAFFSPFSTFAQTRRAKAKTSVNKKRTAAPKPVADLPKVTQIDAAALKNLLKPNGKPRLINFWATWCDPCREEFPDLVKIGADYRDKVDLISISLDELSEVDRDVPKFLVEMKAQTPGYLLKVPDEGAAIAVVSKDWQGGLPFTILFNADGAAVYSKQGKFNTAFLRNEIEKILRVPATAQTVK